MLKHIVHIIIFLGFSTFLVAGGNFAYSSEAKSAYKLIISLQFEEAEKLIAKIKKDDPDNLVVHHLDNYIDFFTIFINEDYNQFKKLERSKIQRIKEIKSGDKNSPYYLFSAAEIHLQWALARLKFEEYLVAFTEVNKAIGLLEENQKKFPDFIANKKSLSALHAIIGTIPDNYKSILKLVSNFDGSIEQGTNEILEVLNYSKTNEFLFEEEAVAIYSLILMHLKNDPEHAWEFIKSSKLDPVKNPLASFLYANIAHKSGRNDKAIEILEKRERSLKYFPMHYLDFMLGSFKLQRLDHDANVYLRSFLNYFFGRNSIKEAYQKLAWYEWVINGDQSAYRMNMDYCLKRGFAQIDEDGQALKEAKSGRMPDKSLLKARILFDGGYYQRAYSMLIIEEKYINKNELNALEFTYRMGRLTHMLKNYIDAIQFYKKAMGLGEDLESYMACNSALQIGLIYEGQRDFERAEQYFKKCSEMESSEYERSLHQKAKAGLNRLKSRG